MALARASFNPNGYSSLDTEAKPRSLEIVKKGKQRALKFDPKEIDDILANMKHHSEYYIRDLRGDLRTQYNMIVRLVNLLYDTDGYRHLYNLVKKHFGDVDNAKPGTLCAYFAGCLISSHQNKGDKCDVLCAGSLPLPKSLAKGKCGETVILCSYDAKSRRYHFRVLSANNNKNDAIIYMDSGSPDTFRGFTKHEKDKLRGMGIQKVSVNWISEGGDHSDDKIAPKVDLDRLKDIDEPRDETDNNDNNGSDLTALWVILIALAVVIIILFLANR